MYKFIFELITSPLNLNIQPLYEYLILLVLNEIAFQIAYYTSPGGKWGSELHWLVRIPMFLIIWIITYGIIFIGKWLLVNWIIVIIILIVIILLVGIIYIIIKDKQRYL